MCVNMGDTDCITVCLYVCMYMGWCIYVYRWEKCMGVSVCMCISEVFETLPFFCWVNLFRNTFYIFIFIIYILKYINI